MNEADFVQMEKWMDKIFSSVCLPGFFPKNQFIGVSWYLAKVSLKQGTSCSTFVQSARAIMFH